VTSRLTGWVAAADFSSELNQPIVIRSEVTGVCEVGLKEVRTCGIEFAIAVLVV
jgi:hypothetical protein